MKKISVEQMFPDQASIVPKPPEFDTIELFRQCFDHPEKVAVHDTRFGQVLCLVDSLPFLQQQDALMDAVLQKHGHTFEQFMELPVERKQELLIEMYGDEAKGI